MKIEKTERWITYEDLLIANDMAMGKYYGNFYRNKMQLLVTWW